jgi:CheY-like chemotaxis protein
MKNERTIFLIDDDMEDQQILSEAVTAIDPSIRCLKFFDAQQALNSLKDTLSPDFIFVDLNMPLMNGYEFMAELKMNTLHSHVPVIVYTTSTRSEDKEKAKQLGAAFFLTKPSSVRELLKMLETVFFTEIKS